MREQIKFAAAILFLLIFLPVLGKMLLTGTQDFRLSSSVKMESVLPMLLYQEIPDRFETEAACAQAVLVRSRVYLDKEEKKKSLADYLKANITYEKKHKINKEKYLLCVNAVKKTEHYVLSYGGRVVEGPYCRASSGWTRNGKEVLSDENMGWLVGVESSADLDYAAERAPVSYTAEKLYAILQSFVAEKGQKETAVLPDQDVLLDQISIETTDSSGYVTEMKVGELQVPGETFRMKLHLPSAAFTMHREAERLYFYCRGLGHGMGLSQNGANVLAREGRVWREILNYYFPNAQIMENAQ